MISTQVSNKINKIEKKLSMQIITTTIMKLWMRKVLFFVLQIITTETRTGILMRNYHN